MPIILNIETSTDVCSICVSNGLEVLAIRETDESYVHASKVTVFIQECLSEANLTLIDIDAVALSKGPGSYTALRIGASTAKGICYALDKPLIAIDTLQSLALASRDKEQNEGAIYCPMIDARRMEVYTALFDASNALIQQTNALIVDKSAFGQYFSKKQDIIFSGNGADKCKNVLQSSNAHFSSVLCSATNLIPLAIMAYEKTDFEDMAYFSPDYHKPPNITTPKKVL